MRDGGHILCLSPVERIRSRCLAEQNLRGLDEISPNKSHQSHLYLQGEDKLYVNSADNLIRMFSEKSNKDDVFGENVSSLTTTLAEGRQWLVIPIPSTYSATNWPVRYSAIDPDGQNMAIAGRTGLAHYSMQTRRWKLFGNESQEKDFIVAGGFCGGEIIFYNKFAKIVGVETPILLINILQDQLITFGSDAQVCIWHLQQNDLVGNVAISKLQAIDISAIAVHPTCIASIALTSLRTETGRGQNTTSESMILNVSGRLLMVQREVRNGERYTCLMPTVLASCVENVWVPSRRRLDKAHLTEALWLFCGAHGMRVWLPLYPRDGDKSHTFMSKRIMLPFHLRIYPLAILFEDAIILGAENDTVLYTTDSNSPFSLPFSVLQRTSQVYLHQILRQLIRRNLGYHAWEIARSCMSLSYFPHSLELLLHEVLEEEATSKEPIPDAQLPSVIEFIMEFPLYLQTVVQCARKTEIALWPYLFSAAGKPKDLFQECMAKGQLDTAASYLIILQNLETSSVSRQYATLLLNTALDQSKWELAKDLVRFLRAIDPNDVESESPRSSFILPPKLALSQSSPPVAPNAEDISLILGNVQGPRVRSYSTTISPKLVERSNSVVGNMIPLAESPQTGRKKSVPNSIGNKNDSRSSPSNTAEEFFIDVILQKHARRLLSAHRLIDLGYFAAHLDFHLVAWLGKERDRAARIDDFCPPFRPGPVARVLRVLFNFIEYAAQSPTETSNMHIMEDHMRSLKIDVSNYPATSSRVGDSGYMSFQGLPCTGLITPMNTLEQSSQIAESELDEHRLKTTTLATAVDESMMSTASSLWGEDREIGTSSTDNWEVPSSQILEQLSITGSKGSHRSEVQLRIGWWKTPMSLCLEDDETADHILCACPAVRGSDPFSFVGMFGRARSFVLAEDVGSHPISFIGYLLQLFMEASCLEWSLLISVLLRDAMAVLRTVNAAKSHDQTIETVSRLRQGLLILNYWTNTECLGYKAFMLAIQNQMSVLTKILETKIQHKQIVEYQQAVSATLNKVTSPKPRSRKSSSNQDSTSIQGSSKEKKGASVGTNHSNDKLNDLSNLPNVKENAVKDIIDNHLVQNNNSCIIS
ncbi:hypothetical protein NQ317_019441 [Molorchus minor]|uniref:Protein RIC1 homolog n=1 Tax=Molorchus minor TaxID=1323400 RepID=A0ABQ9K1W7_9CUCU|nr:hypothetical protein NQ317_019441 [Molorchus minor]